MRQLPHITLPATSDPLRTFASTKPHIGSMTAELKTEVFLMVRNVLLFSAASVALVACSSGSGRLACRMNNADSAALDAEFITREFDATYLPAAALQVTYLATESDSRCPIGVQCVRAGEAMVSIELALDGAAPEQFVLSTSDEIEGNETSARYMGYQIELLDVIPYPEAGQDVAQGDRCGEFVVSETDGQARG